MSEREGVQREGYKGQTRESWNRADVNEMSMGS